MSGSNTSRFLASSLVGMMTDTRGLCGRVCMVNPLASISRSAQSCGADDACLHAREVAVQNSTMSKNCALVMII